MSTTTINFTLRDESDTLIDADSTPVLREEGAVFGVKRNDTSAVVVAAGAAMVRDSLGTYHYTFTDPAAGLVYTGSVEYVYGGETSWLQFTKAGGTSAGDITVSDYFAVDAEDDAAADAAAVAMANNRSGFTSFLAATAAEQRKARNTAAERIDAAYRYQGSKYAPVVTGVAQVREFPRLARGSASTHLAAVQSTAGAGEVWDLNADGDPIVPDPVKLAELYEAEAILAGGTRDERLQARADGLSSQSVGSMSESYASANTNADGTPRLCLDADRIMKRYRISSGRLL